MQTIDFRKFIYFSKNTMGKSGKPIFINPELLPNYLNHIPYKSHDGQLISKKIINDLRAVADGHKSGSALRKRGYFYMDFSYFGKYATRLYYRIFQDKANGSIREPGVYIYDLKPTLSKESSEEGLYEIFHHQASQTWRQKRVKEDKPSIKHKEFVVAGFTKNGSYDIDKTIKTANTFRRENDNSSFNLYFNPGYLIDNNMLWEPPQQRKISKSAGTKELEEILTNTENNWISAIESSETKVYGNSSELVKKVLNSAFKSHKKFTKQTFEFVDPISPLPLLKQLSERCGSQFSDNSYNTLTDLNGIKRNNSHKIPERDNQGNLARYINQQDTFQTSQLTNSIHTALQTNFLDLAKEFA